MRQLFRMWVVVSSWLFPWSNALAAEGEILRSSLFPISFQAASADKPEYKIYQHVHEGSYAAIRLVTSAALKTQAPEGATAEVLCSKSMLSRILETLGVVSDYVTIVSAKFGVAGEITTEWIPIFALQREKKKCTFVVIQSGVITPYFRVPTGGAVDLKVRVTNTEKISISVVKRVMDVVRGTASFSNALSTYREHFEKELPEVKELTRKNAFLTSGDAAKLQQDITNFDKVIEELFGPLFDENSEYTTSVDIAIGKMGGRGFTLTKEVKKQSPTLLTADLFFEVVPRLSMFAELSPGFYNFCANTGSTCSQSGVPSGVTGAAIVPQTDLSTQTKYTPPTPFYLDSRAYPYFEPDPSGFASKSNFYLNGDSPPSVSAHRKMVVDPLLNVTHSALDKFNGQEDDWLKLCTGAFVTLSEQLKLLRTDVMYILWYYFEKTNLAGAKGFADVGCSPLLSKGQLARDLPRMGLRSTSAVTQTPAPKLTGFSINAAQPAAKKAF